MDHVEKLLPHLTFVLSLQHLQQNHPCQLSSMTSIFIDVIDFQECRFCLGLNVGPGCKRHIELEHRFNHLLFILLF